MDRRVAAALRPLTLAFLVLTLAVFLGPPSLLAAPDAPASGGVAVVMMLSAALVVVQLVGLVVAALHLLPARPRSPWLPSILLVGADVLAVTNAVRLAAGVHVGGAAGDVVEALWFAAPLALWAAFPWPSLRRVPSWWGGPLRLVAIAFPFVFFLAALSRIDISAVTGAPTPGPVGWILAYGPTLLVVAVALIGWLAFEEGRASSRAGFARAVAPVAVLGIGAGVAVAGARDFVLSATITWGAGYQLFGVDIPAAPLALSLALAGLALAGFLTVALRIRLRGRSPIPVLLLFAAVLSGVFPNPVSVLGSLLAFQLAWVHLSRPQ